MSWFTDLAGRAEDFLNKVDQGAASALTKPPSQITPLSSSFSASPYDTPDTADGSSQYFPALEEQQQHKYHTAHEPSRFIAAAAGNIKKTAATLLAGTANSPAPSPAGGSGPLKPSSNFVRPKKPELDDELLFDFLNSSDPASGGGVREAKWERPRATVSGEGAPQAAPTPAPAPAPSAAPQAPLSASSSPRSARGLSRTSSLSSLSTSTHSVKNSEDSSAKEPSRDTPESSDSGLAGPPEQTAEESVPAEEPQSQVMSSLRLENQLLRSEVSSLNQEMASLIQRAKDTQEELNQARMRADKWNSDRSRTDRSVREMRSQVDDLTEALLAKDGQLAVLKVRLDEADQLLKSRSSALEEAQCEKSRILQDHSEGNSLHSQALQTLQERLREAESAIKREQDSHRKMQGELAERLAKVEAERQTLAETVTGADRRGTEDRRRAEELQQQAKSARAAAETAKQELQDYKHKASRILQSKEKLISSLKEGSGLEALEVGGAGALELEELRHEKEMQKDEIQKLQLALQTLRAEIQDLESQAMAEAESWREQLQEAQEQQVGQARAKQEVETELERCKQELQYLEEEQHRAKSTLQSRIKDREDEIQKLRNQLTNKTLGSSGQAELESRLHQLTETLIQKQTMLEALGTEKSSLVFQLERLEQQLKSLQGGHANGPAINMSGVEAPGTRMRNVPVLFNDHEGPGAGMYGKVRNAASTIDKFSIRLGIFLRRYPVARVFVILYMALLHLWVMVVLLTYTPEMHHDGPHGR